jgi:hypothetical protein
MSGQSTFIGRTPKMNISATLIPRLMLSIGLSVLLAGNATAQVLPQSGSKSIIRLLVTCGDLERNKWWGSFVQVSINSRSANLASVAGQQCRGVPPDTLLRLPVTSNTAEVPSDPVSRTGMRIAEVLNEIIR